MNLVRLDNKENIPISLVGGKGKGLITLIQNGFNVPRGFVLTTNLYEKDLTKVQDEIFEMFDKLDLKNVAVRSSATMEDSSADSFAGQFQTILGVSKENLLGAIRKCWVSTDLKRIQAYCEQKDIDTKLLKVAVVVQELLFSDASGVCFTVDPVSSDSSKMTIEAVLGMGEGLVSGELTPDLYTLDKNSLVTKNKYISEQDTEVICSGTEVVKQSITSEIGDCQKITDEQVIQIGRTCLDIEKLFNKPMDIEWALANNQLYILQSRPITT